MVAEHAIQCLACGHPYDRDQHTTCPSCTNEPLTNYPTTPEGEADS